jgi:hypothetical protein
VCCTYDLVEGGTEDRWSAGEVILVSDGSNIWDPEKARTRYKKEGGGRRDALGCGCRAGGAGF